jgi:hypothetical protein
VSAAQAGFRWRQLRVFRDSLADSVRTSGGPEVLQLPATDASYGLGPARLFVEVSGLYSKRFPALAALVRGG